MCAVCCCCDDWRCFISFHARVGCSRWTTRDRRQQQSTDFNRFVQYQRFFTFKLEFVFLFSVVFCLSSFSCFDFMVACSLRWNFFWKKSHFEILHGQRNWFNFFFFFTLIVLDVFNVYAHFNTDTKGVSNYIFGPFNRRLSFCRLTHCQCFGELFFICGQQKNEKCLWIIRKKLFVKI